MSGHTPGPWTPIEVPNFNLQGHTGYAIIFNDDLEQVVDFVYEKADANLIAAAPDLLDALESVSAELKKYENTPHPEGADGARDFLVKLMHAKHAIAKAKGQSK